MNAPSIKQVVEGLFGLTIYVVTYLIGVVAALTMAVILLPGFHPNLSEWTAIKLTPWALAITASLGCGLI